ncbi:MAG: hypothetical protein JSV16_10660, partial [Candidatus Hydrogenedentota bacterium]
MGTRITSNLVREKVPFRVFDPAFASLQSDTIDDASGTPAVIETRNPPALLQWGLAVKFSGH